MADISSVLFNLDNIQDSAIYQRTAFNKNAILNYLSYANFFVIHTHGNTNVLLAVDENGSESLLYSSDIAALNAVALSDLKVAFIGACLCGYGGASADNLVNVVFNKGARCVIGYKEKVHTVAILIIGLYVVIQAKVLLMYLFC